MQDMQYQPNEDSLMKIKNYLSNSQDTYNRNFSLFIYNSTGRGLEDIGDEEMERKMEKKIERKMEWDVKVGIALIIILLLAAILRMDFITSVDHEMPHDSLNYDKMVIQLLEDGIYAYNDTEPNAFVTPGYPLFLTAIYWLVDYQNHDPLPWVRMVQVILSLLSIWLIYRITKELSNDIIGLMAALISAVYAPFVWANGAVLTEVLGIFLFLSYILMQIKTFRSQTWTSALISGILLGLTVLVRPEFMPLLVVNYLFYWLWKKRKGQILKLFVISAAGLILVMMPWWIRNIVSLDEWVITATQSNPFKAGTYPYKNYDDGLVNPEGKTEMEVAIERLKVGFTTKPWLFIKWYTVGKLQYIYQNVYSGGGHTPYYNVIPSLNPNYLHRFLVFFGFISILAVLRRWKQMATLLAVIVIVMTLIRLGFVPEYRYNVMSMPLIIILTCIVGGKIVHWLYNKGQTIWKPNK